MVKRQLHLVDLRLPRIRCLPGDKLVVASIVYLFFICSPSFAEYDPNFEPVTFPTSDTIRVGNVTELFSAVAALTSSTTILLEAGDYYIDEHLDLHCDLNENVHLDSIAIRGETGNPDDVEIIAPGMNNYSSGDGFVIKTGNVSNVLIADLSLSECYYHAVFLQAHSGAQAPRLSNLHVYNTGEQLIKVTPPYSGDGCDNGILENSRVGYVGTPSPNYSSGIDVHRGDDWIVRDNYFYGITPASGLADHAIFFWNLSERPVIERNIIVNCSRGIALGLGGGVPETTGGIVRNNVVYRDPGAPGDVGIGAWSSEDYRIYNNTVILNGTYFDAIEARYSGYSGEIGNNLCDADIHLRDGASATLFDNITNAQSSWFVDLAGGDFHLTSSAIAAIDNASGIAMVADDLDGWPRPFGSDPDIGADEYGTPQTPAEVTGVSIDAAASDIVLSWNPVTTDTSGASLAVDSYRVFSFRDVHVEPESGILISEIADTSDTLVDQVAAADTLEIYRIRAVTLDEMGAPSDPVGQFGRLLD